MCPALKYVVVCAAGCEKATPCRSAKWGCCPDLLNPAHGPNKEGCCLNTEFGCCPDNTAPAHGPDNKGCGCEFTEFKCCPDDVTPARGPNFEGELQYMISRNDNQRYFMEVTIEEGFIQKRKQRSSLLLGGQNCFNSLPR